MTKYKTQKNISNFVDEINIACEISTESEFLEQYSATPLEKKMLSPTFITKYFPS